LLVVVVVPLSKMVFAPRLPLRAGLPILNVSFR